GRATVPEDPGSLSAEAGRRPPPNADRPTQIGGAVSGHGRGSPGRAALHRDAGGPAPDARQGGPRGRRGTCAAGLEPAPPAEVCRGRAAAPRVPEDPNGKAARRLGDLRYQIEAGRKPARPEDVCRGRTVVVSGLRRDEAACGQDTRGWRGPLD